MKKYLKHPALITMMLFGACTQDVITPKEQTVEPPVTETPSAGTANFTKFVAVGNSLTSGFQAGALFTYGQDNSFPSMMATQFKLVGGGDFNQPTIDSEFGYNSTYSNPGGGILRGRMILFDPDGPTGPLSATLKPTGDPSLPAPYNDVSKVNIPGAYGGDKAALNNFGVPGIILGQCLTPDTGNPGKAAYNPLWARFASAPGVKSIIHDAVNAQPTFFLFDLGNNDVLGYATTGASGAIPMTDASTFQTYYGMAIDSLLSVGGNVKGVVGNIPDVTSIPFFFTVLYNALPGLGDNATVLNGGFSGYNNLLDLISSNGPLMANFGLTAEDLQGRKVSYNATGSNTVLIADKTLTDLGPVLDYLHDNAMISDADRAALTPYQKVRKANATDLLTLSAGGVLGTSPDANPLHLYGITIPLPDQYVLLPSETMAILTRTAQFNAAISAVVDANSDRLALADVHGAFNTFVTNRILPMNGLFISPSFAPPTGAFSEDGVHPNTRGYAYLANIYIDAINAKFTAKVPKVNVAQYPATGLPVFNP